MIASHFDNENEIVAGQKLDMVGRQLEAVHLMMIWSFDFELEA